MRYALAMICPPFALLACKKWFQAIAATVLFVLAMATARYGIGALVEFFLVLWAFHAVGNDDADRESRDFVKAVDPIPVIRT